MNTHWSSCQRRNRNIIIKETKNYTGYMNSTIFKIIHKDLINV